MSDQTTIREIAEDVYKTLVSGFSEDVSDRAMQVGLRLAKIGYEGPQVIVFITSIILIYEFLLTL
jgi:hypothetical protein